MGNDQCRAAFEKWKTRPDVVLWLSSAGARTHSWRIWRDAWESSRGHQGKEAAAIRYAASTTSTPDR